MFNIIPMTEKYIDDEAHIEESCFHVPWTKNDFEKEIKENPHINEKMIRAMFLQMGRKPSEAQIRQIMKSVNANRK